MLTPSLLPCGILCWHFPSLLLYHLSQTCTCMCTHTTCTHMVCNHTFCTHTHTHIHCPHAMLKPKCKPKHLHAVYVCVVCVCGVCSAAVRKINELIHPSRGAGALPGLGGGGGGGGVGGKGQGGTRVSEARCGMLWTGQ